MQAPSFKSVLDAARQMILAEPDHVWKKFDLAVIDRWKEHPFCDDAWIMVAKASTRDGQHLAQGDFIEWVVDLARLYNHLSVVAETSRSQEDRALATAEKEWRAARNTDVGGVSAGVLRDRANGFQARRIRALGRQPNARKQIIRYCRETFIANCGWPLDSVTEMLVFVVCGTDPGDNEVRDATKPSTRKGRHSAKR